MSDQELLIAAEAIDEALRKFICNQWMYSNYGDYQSFKDYDDNTKRALIEAAKRVGEVINKFKRFESMQP